MTSWRTDLRLNRSREIAGILMAYGWDCLLENFERFRVGKFPIRKNGHGGPLTRPEHLGCAFEELGTSFLKV